MKLAGMKPIAQLPVDRILGVFCDIDDTLTTDGHLTAAAYAALDALKTAGKLVIPITGRPAGWCDHIARMWPVDAVVGENGAFYFQYDRHARKLIKRFLDDEAVRALVNAHQRSDKGFGPALGPDSGARTAQALTDAGYRVTVEKSDWVLGADQAELQRQLMSGLADAAVELAPAETGRIRAWQSRRLAHVDAGTSTVRVGHDDVGGVLG